LAADTLLAAGQPDVFAPEDSLGALKARKGGLLLAVEEAEVQGRTKVHCESRGITLPPTVSANSGPQRVLATSVRAGFGGKTLANCTVDSVLPTHTGKRSLLNSGHHVPIAAIRLPARFAASEVATMGHAVSNTAGMKTP
jgi:hypothetical protein